MAMCGQLKNQMEQDRASLHFNSTATLPAADRYMVTYYTDPLCCWSWAFEKHWRKFYNTFADMFSFRYVMAGMLPNWHTFEDPINNVTRPVHFGALGMHVTSVTQTAINDSVWFNDPPASSYPACMAVSCAALQSFEAADVYLTKLREAIMVHGLNISKNEVLLDLARQTASEHPQLFDYVIFLSQWKSNAPREAFKKDLQLISLCKIGRFPTITLTDQAGRGIIMPGYRPYEALLSSLEYFFQQQHINQKAN